MIPGMPLGKIADTDTKGVRHAPLDEPLPSTPGLAVNCPRCGAYLSGQDQQAHECLPAPGGPAVAEKIPGSPEHRGRLRKPRKVVAR